jgi:hypothetical protein
MKTRSTGLFLCALILILASRAGAQEWRKIVPLKSTRADVERLLGPAEQPYGVDYELKDGVVSIDYSTGPCRKDRPGGWNVSEGIVISFSFSAKHQQRERELKLDRKKFRKVFDTHTVGITYYINDQDGITYEVQQGRVDGVEYYPPKKYQHLYCGDPYDDKLVFERILPALKTTTKVPLRLPSYLATDEYTPALYAILESATPSEYQIQLAFKETCTAGNVCHYGRLSGRATQSSDDQPKGRREQLAKGITGYFVDATCDAACSDSTLTWNEGGYRYVVGLKGERAEALIKVANSAIVR